MLREFGRESADTNSSESFNAVLKRLSEWKERPLDVVVQSFSNLCQYYDVEILRGRYGLGDWTLRPELEGVSVIFLFFLPISL